MASFNIHQKSDPGILLGEELADPPQPPQLEESEPPHPLVGAKRVVWEVRQHVGDEGAPQVSATKSGVRIELYEDPVGAEVKSLARLLEQSGLCLNIREMCEGDCCKDARDEGYPFDIWQETNFEAEIVLRPG